MMRGLRAGFVLLCLLVFNICLVARAGTVQIHDDQLWIDGQAQPQIYGAEIQYFRLRGGPGPNVPRAQVIALWNQALDRAVEAGMNAVSFYIPWDFHEYAEGKFDFDGTVDEDGDGLPDYPSRDVHTFFRLVEEHGIKTILVRPGPYINAEWGFLGFGAVPQWFHDKYPDSHSRNSRGQRTTLYSYEDPDFLRHTKIWFETLYREVLKAKIGPGKPISFLQIDNETNFMWQSIYSHDYGNLATLQYQEFLTDRYMSLKSLNASHGRNWQSWAEVRPPFIFGLNLAEDQDWYRFQDFSLFTYLKKIRKMWTDLGVTEPSVLFTLAESYNATQNGLLPHYKYRTSPDIGMMTVNMYPKTYETPDHTLLNVPFKADHDVKAAAAASEGYLGHREAWAMGPEIQGGWWRGIDVSDAARRQTYLTTLGHGLKALFIYYFNEGENWQPAWMKNSIAPYFKALKSQPKYSATPENYLPDEFWNELDESVANNFMVVNTRGVWFNGGTQPGSLYFDAPLGGDAQPRAPYALVKSLGEKIVKPYGGFLGKAHELEDAVCVVKDSENHVPTGLAGITSRIVQSDWAGGLLALLMHSGINARIHHWNLNATVDLLNPKKCKLVIYQDTGLSTPEFAAIMKQVLDQGGSVLSFISPGLANTLKATQTASNCAPLPTTPMNVLGYRCQMGAGSLYFAKVAFYDVFNTDFYAIVHDINERRGVMDRILQEVGIAPQVKIKGGGDRTVAFARANPAEDELWITAKTSRHEGFKGSIQWTRANPQRQYAVTEVFTGVVTKISGSELANQGFSVDLGDSGSTSFDVKPL